jgi:hypothetical protein
MEAGADTVADGVELAGPDGVVGSDVGATDAVLDVGAESCRLEVHPVSHSANRTDTAGNIRPALYPAQVMLHPSDLQPRL